MDDVIIHKDTWVEHVRQVAVVQAFLRHAVLMAKPKKCDRERPETGHPVGGQLIITFWVVHLPSAQTTPRCSGSAT